MIPSRGISSREIPSRSLEGLPFAPSAFVQERLAAVLQAAMGTPGYGPRLRGAGLICDHQGAPGLAPDWVSRFTALPLLTKAEIRQRPGQFLASVADITYRGSTSGSRGQAYEFFAGTAWNQARHQAHHQGLARWGITPEVPILNLNSRLWPSRWGDLALGGPLTPAMLAMLADSLRHTPTALRGYPSRLCDVASALSRAAIDLPSLRAVVCTGEPLFDQQQRWLERVFQAPVVNEYGCHESAAFGMTCPEAGRLHLDEHRCYYEILDQHLITTDLWNQTMPLLRYQSGDLVKLYPTPCPCGRPGPTVDILGRMEDQVTTTQGVCPPGQVSMPPLAGLQHYRIQRLLPGQVSAWAVTEACLPADSTPPQAIAQNSLQRWTQATFGEAALTITWGEADPWQEQSPTPWSDEEWATTITQQSLGAWLQAGAMPTGEAAATADLLKALVSPRVIGQPLPWVIRQKIAPLAEASIGGHPALDILRLRILLLATSALPPDEALALYGQTLEHLQRLETSQALPAAARLDSLIPGLHLPPKTTAAAWGQLIAAQRSEVRSRWPLDPLNAHHLLAAFDGVIHRHAPSKRPPVAQALTPLLAVLVGDLRQWAAEFTPAHLSHWIALVQGQAPLELTDWLSTNPANTTLLSPLAQAWLTWRQRLIQSASGQDQGLALAQAWHSLEAATPPDQQARLWIERGYGQRVQGQGFDPAQWLPVLNTYVPDALNPSQPIPTEATPWLPIVQALAQPLHEQGQLDLAYRCLQVATLAPRQHMAFVALTQTHNTKQTVLMDRLPWPGA
ncbi:MAG: hypothetical protein VKI82_12545 [Leptolyngbya sp.]|nr:hypothetical protein [Leptolyngbya sp.]